MPFTTVVAGTTITAAYANANIRDQNVTPFASTSARTSAVTSPVDGMLSYLQDADRFDAYNGSAWVPAGAQKIQTVTTAGANTITFSSIPGVFTHLYLVGYGSSDAAATFNVDVGCQFNADTGANYSHVTWDGAQGFANPTQTFQNAKNGIDWCGAIPGAGYSSSRAGAFWIVVPGYADTTRRKITLSDSVMTDSGTSVNVHKRWGFWNNTSAITQIDLYENSTGNWTSGSSVTLYGLP